jgi:hypothetical protein
MAALDGALIPLLLAGGIGLWAANRSHTLSADSADLINESTFHAIEQWAAAKVDEKTGRMLGKEEQDERRTTAKALLAKLEKQHKLDTQGNATLRGILGVGAFAAPLLGLGYVAGTFAAEHANDKERAQLHGAVPDEAVEDSE